MVSLQRIDIAALLKDESLMQDLVKGCVRSTEATEDPVEDIADWLGGTIEDEP